MAGKKCTKCGVTKSLSSYYKDGRIICGYKSACNDCMRPQQTRAARHRRKYQHRLVEYFRRLPNYSGSLEEYAEWAEARGSGWNSHSALSAWVVKHTKKPAKHLLCKECKSTSGSRMYCSSRCNFRWRYNNDSSFRLSECLRRQVNKSLECERANNAIRRVLRGKGSFIINLLGCNAQTFYDHMIKQMPNDMTEADLSSGDVHIDHIRGRALFDLTDPKQWQECWHFTNLRPLWAIDNWSRPKDCRDVLL